MKQKLLLLLLLYSLSSLSQNYYNDWEKVVKYENLGKIKSANKNVEAIYKKAKLINNEAQIIKCFFYKSKYSQILDENAQLKILYNLNEEIKSSSIPSKAILNYIYAKCLDKYVKKHTYKLYNRTKIDSTSRGDFLTWTFYDFENEIKEAYNNSIINEVVLKKTPLKKYDAIFDYISEEKFNSLSLYDYLNQQNIDYLSTKINMSNFKEFSNIYIESDEKFKAANFDTINNIDLKYLLQLFQNSISEENQLKRIKLFHNNLNSIDDEYLKILNSYQKSSKDEKIQQEILLKKSDYYKNLASKELHPDYNKKVVLILDSIINYKNRTGLINQAEQIKKEITKSYLSITLLKNCYEKENIRAQINYKNIDNYKLIFYKVNSNFEDSNLLKDSIYDNFKLKNKIYKSVDYSLNNNKDYFYYTTEILLPQLELGTYIVIAETTGNEILITHRNFQKLHVSNSSVIAHRKNKTIIYQVLNRKTGKPIENCIIKNDDFNIKTNKNGIAEYKDLRDEKKYYNYYKDITITNNNDTLQIDNHYLYDLDKYASSDKKQQFEVNFYLDRAIYRPGQKVFFKGIIIQKSETEKSVLANLLLKIEIKDVNSEVIKTLEVTTNEFGSFSGEFVLPKNILTGNFRINASEPDDYEDDLLYDKIKEEHPIWDNSELLNSSISFKVEEYKRPKFEIIFDDIKETYIINQEIQLNGKAKSFSGSTIANSNVKYTIERKVYQNWNDYYGYSSQIIYESETKTDNDGNFKINFTAKPDVSYNNDNDVIFSYLVKATITDINGETQSNNTKINVGHKSLILEIAVPDKIITSEKNKVVISCKNLNNQFIATNADLKIYYLKEYSNKFKKNVFGIPEIQTISSEEFNRLFPFENIEKSLTNELGTLTFSKKINTQINNEIELDFISKYKSGYYKVILSTKDKFNNLIESKKIFEILQSNDKKATGNELITLKQLNENPLKDGFIKIKINSAVPDLYLNCVGIYSNSLIFEETISLKNFEYEIKIPLEKKFKNEILIAFETIFENQYFKFERSIELVDVLPEISIEIETFRNKIEPNSKENWSFSIKEDGKNIPLEVLASMYDSSLDKFALKNWDSLNSKLYSNNNYYGKNALGFEKVDIAFYINNTLISPIYYPKDYKTSLIWFGFDFNNSENSITKEEYNKQITKKAKKPKNSKLISGIISDDSGPLPGANIVIKNTIRQVNSDVDGYFEIEAKEGETMIISFSGYESTTLPITKNINNEISIQLIESIKKIDEVVVGSFGRKIQTKKLAYSSQKVEKEELVVAAPTNAVTALSGKVSGINIITKNNDINPSTSIVLRGYKSIGEENNVLLVIDGIIKESNYLNTLNADEIIDVKVLKESNATMLYGSQGKNGALIITTKRALQQLEQIKTRTNLSETAFFYPHIKTDNKGNLKINFTSPEALTQWKFRLFAHTKKGNSNYLQKTVVTQKEIMVVPNMPRFFREKDTIIISAKISNMTKSSKTGIASLQFFDATTMKSIDVSLLNKNLIKNYTINAFGSTNINWKIFIPEGLQGIQYKIVAKAGNYSDGEESILPVLTNSILVTESLPIWVRENSKKEYTFENLKNNSSTTLRQHQFTLEYTSNPTWIAIQSLPYLMEYEHECAEQTFARFYANSLASEIINSNPKIGKLFEDWKAKGKLTSNLEQNEELKSMILAETPWLRDAESEEEKKNKLALLFDLEKMKNTQDATFEKLKNKQNSSGGFVWFDGGTENEYITRHILAGLGHLKKLKVTTASDEKISEVIKKGVLFIDTKFSENDKIIIDYQKKYSKFNSINPYSNLHYLYTRSFYLEDYPISDSLKAATKKYLDATKEYWLNYSLYEKGLAALTLNRFGEKETAKMILQSLKETSSNNEDWGMYWIENKSGWYWYQAPIETQALLIEVFSEIDNDRKSVDAMKVWLLKNKQAKNWPTTKSTTEAIYALLMQGTDWLSVKDNTIIKVGDEKIMTKKLSENEKEAETGYIKTTWKADETKPEMASISIENKSKVPGFGGVYWQYFEDLDKIKTNVGGNLSTSKELYLKKTTNKGAELQKINTNNPLKIGDLATVRLIIVAKENMEYVHLKDMRASCFEPTNVISEYKWKDGLGFYMCTKDASTHFFFDTINKGTYVLEYDIRVNNIGDFSNGITTIESMYAPEFTSHTKGIRVVVKE